MGTRFKIRKERGTSCHSCCRGVYNTVRASCCTAAPVVTLAWCWTSDFIWIKTKSPCIISFQISLRQARHGAAETIHMCLPIREAGSFLGAPTVCGASAHSGNPGGSEPCEKGASWYNFAFQFSVICIFRRNDWDVWRNEQYIGPHRSLSLGITREAG